MLLRGGRGTHPKLRNYWMPRLTCPGSHVNAMVAESKYGEDQRKCELKMVLLAHVDLHGLEIASEAYLLSTAHDLWSLLFFFFSSPLQHGVSSACLILYRHHRTAEILLLCHSLELSLFLRSSCSFCSLFQALKSL